jgi:hypothetical protein
MQASLNVVSPTGKLKAKRKYLYRKNPGSIGRTRYNATK